MSTAIDDVLGIIDRQIRRIDEESKRLHVQRDCLLEAREVLAPTFPVTVPFVLTLDGGLWVWEQVPFGGGSHGS